MPAIHSYAYGSCYLQCPGGQQSVGVGGTAVGGTEVGGTAVGGTEVGGIDVGGMVVEGTFVGGAGVLIMVVEPGLSSDVLHVNTVLSVALGTL